VRIVRIPLEGRAAIQELVTVTSDVWGITADPDGSVLVNLVDRPAELVGFTARGGQPLKIASFPKFASSGNWNVLTRRRDRGSVDYLCWSPDGSTIISTMAAPLFQPEHGCAAGNLQRAVPRR